MKGKNHDITPFYPSRIPDLMFVTKEKDGRVGAGTWTFSTFCLTLVQRWMMWWIAVDNVVVLQRSLGIPFFKVCPQFLQPHRRCINMGTWCLFCPSTDWVVLKWMHESTSLAVDVLVDHNEHIHLCCCGLILCHSRVHRWSHWPWLGSSLILLFPCCQIQCSSFFPTSWFPHWCQPGVMLNHYRWTTTGTTETIGFSLLRYIISCRRWMDVVVEGG